MHEENLDRFLKGRGYVFVQMDRSAVGHFEVEAEINGHDVLLLVDTGASKTVLHDATAEQIGIKPEDAADCGGGLGTTNAVVSTALINVFKLGELEFEEFPLYIMDFSHPIAGIEEKGGRTIDGVVGADVLGSRSAIIDCEEAKLYLKVIERNA